MIPYSKYIYHITKPLKVIYKALINIINAYLALA